MDGLLRNGANPLYKYFPDEDFKLVVEQLVRRGPSLPDYVHREFDAYSRFRNGHSAIPVGRTPDWRSGNPDHTVGHRGQLVS